MEYADSANARADAFAYLLDLQTQADIEALANSSLAMEKVLNTMNVEDVARRSLLAGLAGGAGFAGAASGSRYAAQAAATYNLNISAGAISAPDDFVLLIQDTIQRINRGGDPLTTAGAL